MQVPVGIGVSEAGEAVEERLEAVGLGKVGCAKDESQYFHSGERHDNWEI